MELFEAALEELRACELLDIEGEDGTRGMATIIRKRPLQFFEKARQEFTKTAGTNIDHDLFTKFHEYLLKNYRDLADTKVCLTKKAQNSVIVSLRSRKKPLWS